jgi:hypothetical protein
MDVYLNQLRRIIDRIIMPQFPELESYKISVAEKNNYNYISIVYYPKELRGYNFIGGVDPEESKWKNITNLTKSYYDATGHDEYYILGAIGEKKHHIATPPVWWWWRLDEKTDWRKKRDDNTKFYERMRNELN